MKSALADTQNAFPGFAWTATPDGEIHSFNRRWCDYTGRSEDELKGRGWQDVVDPHDLPRLLAGLEQSPVSGAPVETEVRLRGSDGKLCWFLFIAYASVNVSGRPVEWSGFCTNIDARKRTEEDLRRNAARFKDYAETASDWLWEIGTDYTFTMLTENAFGADPEDRIGTRCWDHALDFETEQAKWLIVLETLDARKPFRDFIYCSADRYGQPLYVKASGKPVFGEDGEFCGYRGTGTDVTAVMRAEKAEASLRTAEAELAHICRITTLSQLTASIAHELTQPISAALMNAETALGCLGRQSPNTGLAMEAVRRILRDGTRASEIITRTREMVKKVPARKDDVEINEAISEVIGLTRSEVSKNDIQLQIHLADRLPLIRGDRVQLQQVMLNLIMNAVESMSQLNDPQRGLLISTAPENDAVLVAVRDTGPGLTSIPFEQPFEAFYTTKTTGLGMGLSICRSIVEAHGGRIWAAANKPRGAAFQFTVPVLAKARLLQ